MYYTYVCRWYVSYIYIYMDIYKPCMYLYLKTGVNFCNMCFTERNLVKNILNHLVFRPKRTIRIIYWSPQPLLFKWKINFLKGYYENLVLQNLVLQNFGEFWKTTLKLHNQKQFFRSRCWFGPMKTPRQLSLVMDSIVCIPNTSNFGHRECACIENDANHLK